MSCRGGSVWRSVVAAPDLGRRGVVAGHDGQKFGERAPAKKRSGLFAVSWRLLWLWVCVGLVHV